MNLSVTYDTNFIRIFRLPTEYPKGFCFGGGYPVQMQLVDWFNPLPPLAFDSKPRTLKIEHREEIVDKLREFIREKPYFKDYPDHKFLAITDYGEAFIV
ncbi:MAG: hypothetical protein WC346_00020 [Methanogenium sp.]|jgi:hypothetical protein